MLQSQKLQMERAELAKEWRAFTDNPDPDMSDDAFSAECDRFEKQIARLDRMIEGAKKIEAENRSKLHRVTQFSVPEEEDTPITGGTPIDHEDEDGLIRPLGNGRARTVANLFPNVELSNGGFRNLAEFVRTITYSPNDPRLQYGAATGVAQESVGTDGGFAVPTQFVGTLLDGVLSGATDSIVMPRATIYPLTSNVATAANFQAYDQTSGRRAGVIAEIVPEGGTFTKQKPLLEKINWRTKKIGVLTAASNEILADTNGFDGQLAELMRSTVADTFDNAFLNGDTPSGIKGILESGNNAKIVVSKESAQAADTIVRRNITNMVSRLHPKCWRNAVWVAHVSTLPDLLEIEFTTDGTRRVPILQQDGDRYSMLTKPVLFSDAVPILGDSGDIALIDFSRYGVAVTVQASLQRSEHAGFLEDETYFRFITRADGVPLWREPITPRKGSTLSCFVVLEDRA